MSEGQQSGQKRAADAIALPGLFDCPPHPLGFGKDGVAPLGSNTLDSSNGQTRNRESYKLQDSCTHPFVCGATKQRHFATNKKRLLNPPSIRPTTAHLLFPEPRGFY